MRIKSGANINLSIKYGNSTITNLDTNKEVGINPKDIMVEVRLGEETIMLELRDLITQYKQGKVLSSKVIELVKG